ncbi:MAG: hypothetical protein LBG58_08990 [Planctomycetaceae bacterium]|nr:hypothetical protein [Planctomycetaceae bacterium]
MSTTAKNLPSVHRLVVKMGKILGNYSVPHGTRLIGVQNCPNDGGVSWLGGDPCGCPKKWIAHQIQFVKRKMHD